MALHRTSDRPESARGSGPTHTKGWEVRTRVDDKKVGKVDDVLIEDSGEARFLDVDLGLFSKRVLLPVERARTDAVEEVVWVDGFDKDGFEEIPEYDGNLAKLNADYREGLLQAYSAVLTRSTAVRSTGTATAGATVPRDHSSTKGDDDRVDDTRAASPAGDTHLGRVGELSDYEVADDHSDVRGWDVMASDDRKIGKVKELVADTVAMKVRYLDVELETDFRRSDEESRVLVPIEHARLIEDREVVWLDALASQKARDIPVHRGTFDRDYEARVARVFPADTLRNPNAPRR